VATAREDSPAEADGAPLSRRRRDLVSKAWRHLSDERRTLGGLAVLSVLAAQVEAVALVLIAVIADGAARGTTAAEMTAGPIHLSLPISTAAILAATGILITAALVLWTGLQSAKTYARLERESRNWIVTSYAAADWEFQSTQKSSRVQGRLLRLMDARAVAFGGLVGWTRAVVTIVVFVGVAAVVSPLAAAVIMAFGIMLSLAVLPIRRAIVRLGGRTADEEVGLAVDVAEAADHGSDVHIFGAWPAFLSRFDAKSRSLEALRARLGATKNLTPLVYQYGALILILSILLVAVAMQSDGEIGQVAASALLLLRSVQYGQQIQHWLQQIAESVPRIELLERQLAAPKPRFVPGDRTLDRIDRLDLADVCYQYPGSDQPALTNVSLTLAPGRIVGLAGPSGSGKSTLAQILLRVRWPTSGQYLINGFSVQEYSPDSWHRLVSHVPQQPRLLHGSLAENVSFLDETINADQIAECLRAVGLEDLMDLPGGLAADLGPTGRSLSGGQVQRLGIARALVREPKLVILDEPTSALDVNAERLVGDALAALRGRSDVLVVVIAHRASTLAFCDEIVVMQDGRVVAAGRSDEVALESEFLARTWDATAVGLRRDEE